MISSLYLVIIKFAYLILLFTIYYVIYVNSLTAHNSIHLPIAHSSGLYVWYMWTQIKVCLSLLLLGFMLAVEWKMLGLHPELRPRVAIHYLYIAKCEVPLADIWEPPILFNWLVTQNYSGHRLYWAAIF